MDKPLILASSSKYRRELLSRLRLPFSSISPDLDETPGPGEAAQALAQRLSVQKARAVADAHPQAWVIGSDQVPSQNGRVLDKPGDRDTAIRQLREFSGQSLVFHTGVALVSGDRVFDALDTTVVRFRRLSGDEISRYVDAEPAWDCAGSFKAEGLGIGLFDSVESSDPTALVGLPLVALARLLRQAGYAVP